MGFIKSITVSSDWPQCDFGEFFFCVDTVASLLFFLYWWNKMKNSLKTEKKGKESKALAFLYLPAQESNVGD